MELLLVNARPRGPRGFSQIVSCLQFDSAEDILIDRTLSSKPNFLYMLNP
jgi:hypothetical protein